MAYGDPDNEDDDKMTVPKYPKDIHNKVKIGEWKQAMTGYLLTKGLLKTARSGRRGAYPGSVSSISDTAEKMDAIKELDQEANGKVFGVMVKSVKGITMLHETLMKDGGTYFDSTSDHAGLGLGSLAWRWLCTRDTTSPGSKFHELKASLLEREKEVSKGPLSLYQVLFDGGVAPRRKMEDGTSC